MATKVLLVRPPAIKPQHSGWPPFGIGYIASYLAAHAPEVSIKAIDFDAEPFSAGKWQQELSLYQPDIVGISILMLSAANGLKLARLCKQVDPMITTVLGGVQASLFPHEFLESYDIVVRGEGEKTFYEIVQGHDLFYLVFKMALIQGQFVKLFNAFLLNARRASPLSAWRVAAFMESNTLLAK